MTDADFVIYKGFTFADLCKDIVMNSESKKHQLDILTTELKESIKTANDALVIVPLLREYYDVGVKNDEQLVKLAGVIQRIISKQSEGTENLLLSDDEKKQLLEEVEFVTKPLKLPDIEKIKELKEKSP